MEQKLLIPHTFFAHLFDFTMSCDSRLNHHIWPWLGRRWNKAGITRDGKIEKECDKSVGDEKSLLYKQLSAYEAKTSYPPHIFRTPFQFYHLV